MGTMTNKDHSEQQSRRTHHSALVQVWRWRVAAAAEPVPLNWALAVGEGVLQALARNAWTIRGSGKLPICLHGPEIKPGKKWSHDHAFVLPEDADGDGAVDHISVTARMGLDPSALRLLVATDRVMLSNGVWLELVLERAGGMDVAVDAGPSTEWVSRTAYVPPNDRPPFTEKDATRQLKYEIKERGLQAALKGAPQLVGHLDIAGNRLDPDSFHLDPDWGEGRPERARPRLFRLEFETPVSGPLAFGWGCHKGLGQFVPVVRPASRAGRLLDPDLRRLGE